MKTSRKQVSSEKFIRRKLQFAGNSSYVLTLPKQWIVNVGLDKKNSEVFIEEMPDASIRVIPTQHKDQKKKTRTQTLPMRENTSQEEIIRLILASYLASKSVITIKSINGKMIKPHIALAINQICQKLWGSEIIEESADTIVIHDALNPGQITLNNIIEKAWFTAKNMLEQAFEAIFTRNEDLAKYVENSENTLDKLYYLALRQLYKASSNMLFASEIGIKPSEIIDYHLLIKNIERIGDHAEQLVQHFNKELENMNLIQDAAKMTQAACEDAIKAFFTIDLELAQIAINQKSRVQDFVSKINVSYDEFPISRSILRITDYASDIGELVLNRVITDTE